MDKVVFNFAVPNDDNRAADGRELRYAFLESLDQRFTLPLEENFIGGEVTLLEVIVALCYRLEFQAERGVNRWFRILLENLNLEGCHDDAITVRDTRKIDMILQRLNERRYKANGRGGLFPLREPDEDQTKVEIWYQMAKYITENVTY